MSPTQSEGARIVVIAGPNGAGKTTAAPRLLKGALRVSEFVNADTIAQGLSAFDPESVAIDAARIMLRRLKELANEGGSFAFETTLASRSFAPWISSLRQQGWRFHLLYLWLPSPDLACFRVEDRVRHGGHNVPDETINRRYGAGLRNFFHLYQSIADNWRMYDNSSGAIPRIVALGKGISRIRTFDTETWREIQEAGK